MSDHKRKNAHVDTNEMTKKPYETPALVELDIEDTEAGGPGLTDSGFLS